MQRFSNRTKLDFSKLKRDPYWDSQSELESPIHRIHGYPAKFPAFLTTQSLQFAKAQGIRVDLVADIFCGCGTTAFEARRNNKSFWGCDINPIATLIARTKSESFQERRLQNYFKHIMLAHQRNRSRIDYNKAPERLQYWFPKHQYTELARLQTSILEQTPPSSKYRDFFLCAFSNILKPTSRWLTKSIKPQLDPQKIPTSVTNAFEQQVALMFKATSKTRGLQKTNSQIVTDNFLTTTSTPIGIDLVVTSPPYVTSYEYADLHQLSTLWLGYCQDYRSLRMGSIGSLYHSYNFNRRWKNLNVIGNRIVSSLFATDRGKARSVAKYFLDMQCVTKRVYDSLSKHGMAVFIIGNTEYKNVRVTNAEHLAESLLKTGFRQVLASKRKISQKTLTPYRDDKGRFTTDSSGRHVYAEEFIIVAKKSAR